MSLYDRIRAVISDAYYEARNTGQTMTDAADLAAQAVMSIVDPAIPTEPPRLTSDRANTAVVTIAGVSVLFSYETAVAYRLPGSNWVCSENIWSNTTGRHMTGITGVDKRNRVPYLEFQERLADVFKGVR